MMVGMSALEDYNLFVNFKGNHAKTDMRQILSRGGSKNGEFGRIPNVLVGQVLNSWIEVLKLFISGVTYFSLDNCMVPCRVNENEIYVLMINFVFSVETGFTEINADLWVHPTIWTIVPVGWNLQGQEKDVLRPTFVSEAEGMMRFPHHSHCILPQSGEKQHLRLHVLVQVLCQDGL
eukprot:TRINITY_DN1181_c0_g1_i9.p1 TRINITY_DN1181_c0_g1~~TRINITY_DN1181_c0_g1_i9.p1  ORF type:complete len:177 (+),score=13.53 TRINITY_DN1181_c0_g1_i9:254-784(+)